MDNMSSKESSTSEFEGTGGEMAAEDDDAHSKLEESSSFSSPKREMTHDELDGSVKPLEAEEIEVNLEKEDSKGLGFTLASNASTKRGCYIKGIIHDPALSEGTLMLGDKLIKVNGIDISDMNHYEAATCLRHAPRIVTLRVHRDPNYIEALGESSEKSGSDNTEEYNTDTGTFSQGENIRETEKLFSFLDTQASSNLDENRSESDSDSPSEEEDNREIIQDTTPQDSSDVKAPSHHLDIPCGENESDNDQSEESGDVSRSLEKDVDSCSDEMHGSLDEAGTSFLSTLFSLEGGVMKINLEKPDSGDLGFSLVTAEKDNQTGIFVHKITENSIAANDGRLQIMDRIIQINGESLVGLNHIKAAAILKKSPKEVTLTVSRLSSRQLDLMTPPVIMDDDDVIQHEYSDSENENSDDEKDDLVDEGTFGRPGTPEGNDIPETFNRTTDDDDIINDFDSDDEKDISALVIEAEKLLAANETIELPQEQIRELLRTTSPPVDESKDSFFDVEDFVPKQITLPSEDLAKGDNTLSTGDTNGTDAAGCKTFTIVSSPRNLQVSLPKDLTPDWLFSLPLVSIQDEHRPSIPNLIDQLQNKIEMDDPVEEYKELRQIKPTDNCDIAKMAENKVKNRFRNVLPFDINRVELSGDPDYINASHIIMNIGESECHYIACQGPLPNTTEDFWQMIWEQEVDVIAMLTLDMESKKVKCHRYWPYSSEEPLFVCENQYKVSLVSLQSLDDFDIREIEIEKLTTGSRRTVHHYNYTTWPDHGVPSSAIPLLQSLQLMHIQHRTGPILVHCSAGIGRTGAFITIDVALAHIEQNNKCDIYEIVQELRKQRQGMIQTKDQYLFCYCACIEALLSSTNESGKSCESEQ